MAKNVYSSKTYGNRKSTTNQMKFSEEAVLHTIIVLNYFLPMFVRK